VGGAIQQFLRDVDWGDLDYLVIDLPPGTSDAQLTLAQSVLISGSVWLTTPQDVPSPTFEGARDVRADERPGDRRGENMSAFVCPHCGEATEIFGRAGRRFAREHGLGSLAQVLLDITVRQGGDAGVPRSRSPVR
jgi:ATP-binding protein involved in chromosome partitioning